MARTYQLKQRAAKQAETRRRIVEAAVALHTELGPARTTLSAVAEHAGVQRHTLYAHFPTERDLFEACSGLHLEREPLPDPEAWLEAPPGAARLRRALAELYAYFERNERLLANVIRDAEVHPVAAETVTERFAPRFARMRDVLAECAPAAEAGQAALGLALDLAAWRALRLDPDAAAEAMTRAVLAQ